MELGATMELRVGRDGQLREEDTPYIVEGQIQPLSTNPACAAWYYRTRVAVLPQGIHGPGTVGTDIKNYIRDYLR